jgi:hypothetical protein
MFKKLNCVNCEPINEFTRIYPSETSVGLLFNLYLCISFLRVYSRYSDVGLKNIMWREIWIHIIKGILMMLNKASREMKQKNNFRESNL